MVGLYRLRACLREVSARQREEEGTQCRRAERVDVSVSTEASRLPEKRGRTPGRPTRQDAEAIDRNVLKAARENFLAAGFGGTTMDAIAKQAGVTKATLYQRYDDKAALLRAVMLERVAEWTSVSDQRVVARGTTLETRLRHYAGSITKWSRDPEVRSFGELIRECWSGARAVAEEMQNLRVRRILDVIERDIIQLGANEGVVPSDPRLVAEMFLGMVSGLHRHLEEEVQWPEEGVIAFHLDHLVGIFCSGKTAW